MKSILIEFGQLLFTLSLYLLGGVILGLALLPATLLVFAVWEKAAEATPLVKGLAVSFGVAVGYFLFGLTLLGVVAFFRLLLGWKLKEGEYQAVSLGALRWACTNALYLVVAATFMDFILVTPLAPLFYRFMGAKVGRNVQINSKYCADLSLLEIGDYSVIGGHATVIAHSFERDRLILRRVKIGKGVTIGLNSVVLPGAEIGDGAIIAAGAIVPKSTLVPPHCTYTGPQG